jgi:hypothetical protein
MGFVDRETPLGRSYVRRRADNVFYRNATFHGSAEIDTQLREAGFDELAWAQTLFGSDDATGEVEPVWPGRGMGGFVAVRAVRR